MVRPIRLLGVKFIDWRPPPMSRNAAEAIRHAVDYGARIINASWEVGLKSRQLEEAHHRAAMPFCKRKGNAAIPMSSAASGAKLGFCQAKGGAECDRLS